MFIVPLNSSITPLNTPSQVTGNDVSAAAADASQPSFRDVFKEAYENVQETQQTVREDSVKLVMGEIDDLHTINLNAKKAQMAVQTFVALKNTAIDAYKELMNISM